MKANGGQIRAALDHPRHRLMAERRQYARLHQPVQGRRQVRHGIDKRAIKIQQQGSRHYVALRNVN